MEMIILGVVLGLAIGGAVGYAVRKRITDAKIGTADLRANQLLEEARAKARQQTEDIRQQAEREFGHAGEQ